MNFWRPCRAPGKLPVIRPKHFMALEHPRSERREPQCSGVGNCPLMCPVAAHFVASVDMTAFHAICPNDILVHGCEQRLHVTSVEAVVNTFKQVHFVRHSSLPSSWSTLAQIPFSYTFLFYDLRSVFRSYWSRKDYLGLLSGSSATLPRALNGAIPAELERI